MPGQKPLRVWAAGWALTALDWGRVSDEPLPYPAALTEASGLGNAYIVHSSKEHRVPGSLPSLFL